MSESVATHTFGRSLQITMTRCHLVPVESVGIIEGVMVLLNAGEPGVDDAAAAMSCIDGPVNDLGTTDSETIGRDGTRNRMAPFSPIFCTILSDAVCSSPAGVLFPDHSPYVPFVDVTMEAGNDHDA